jgi:hypothetical protein
MSDMKVYPDKLFRISESMCAAPAPQPIWQTAQRHPDISILTASSPVANSNRRRFGFMGLI